MQQDGKLRLDKWLWAARFFKTRALAKAAIEGGKVQCQGERCKPSKEIRVGDRLQVRQGFDVRDVDVLVLSEQRRGAPEAQALYAETAESLSRREAAAAQRKALGASGLISEHRPPKSSGGKFIGSAMNVMHLRGTD